MVFRSLCDKDWSAYSASHNASRSRHAVACPDHTAISVNSPAVLPRHFTLHCRHPDAFQMSQMMSHSWCHCCLMQNESDNLTCLCYTLLSCWWVSVMWTVLTSKVCLGKWRAKQTLQELRGWLRLHRSNLSSTFLLVEVVFFYVLKQTFLQILEGVWGVKAMWSLQSWGNEMQGVMLEGHQISQQDCATPK